MGPVNHMRWPFLSHIIDHNTIIPSPRNNLIVVMRIKLCAKHSVTVSFYFTLALIFKINNTFKGFIIIKFRNHGSSCDYKEFSKVRIINSVITHSIDFRFLLLNHSASLNIILFDPPSIWNCNYMMLCQPFLWFRFESKVWYCIMISSVLPFMNKSSWAKIIDSHMPVYVRISNIIVFLIDPCACTMMLPCSKCEFLYKIDIWWSSDIDSNVRDLTQFS